MFNLYKKFKKYQEKRNIEKKKLLEIKENAVNENGEYLSCRFIQGGVTFMHASIRACCSGKCKISFVENYKGEDVDWKEIDKQRKKIIEQCKKGHIPQDCKGCVDLQKQKWESQPLIEEIYLNYWIHCNCGCIYCVQEDNKECLQTEVKPSDFYSAYKHIKYLYENNMVSKNAHIELVGGDLTLLDEADDIINFCLDYGVGRISFHSSCVGYSKGIERALKEAPLVNFDFSLDSGSRELYKKIKRIDAFDQTIENLKRYLACSERAKDFMVAKYIIVDGLNDSVEELDKWLNLINELGIKYSRIDVNLRKFLPEFHNSNPTVPPHYYPMIEHYNKKIKEFGIQDCCWEFSKRVFEEGGIPSGYNN